MNARGLSLTAALLGVGALGGIGAFQIQMPMPWMLGSLLSVALFSGLTRMSRLTDYTFPLSLRSAFVTLIGVMIGAQVSPSFFHQLSALPWTLAALVGFVLLAQAGNQVIFTRLGRLDAKTAFYCSTPGGLMEAIFMSEKAGADDRVVMLQQFLRVVLVIFSVPMGLSIWAGEPLGSAAGFATAPDQSAFGVLDFVWIVLAAAVGLKVGKVIGLPAAQITGPMLVSAAVSMSGLVDLNLPGWLIAIAQVVVGVGLGTRFIGVSGQMIRRSILLCMTSVAFMLTLSICFAQALTQVTGIPFVHMFLGFAPGGVTEMSLVALSLALNPTLISLHHILRILLTVFFMGVLARRFGFGPED